MSTYEAWRATHQDAEAAAKAAFEQAQVLAKMVDGLQATLGAQVRFAVEEFEKDGMRLVNAGELQMVVDALRRLHAENQELKEQMAAIGAGGVEPLRKQAAPAALAVPMAEAWEQSAADTEHQRTGAGLHYNQGVAEGLRICAKDLRTSLAATPAAGELATLQAGLQAAAPNAPLYDPREVAFSAQPAAQGMDARDAAFEAVRKAFCKLQRYSFFLDGAGNVRRCADHCGNWVEFDAVHTLFEPQSVDAAIASQAKQGGADHG